MDPLPRRVAGLLSFRQPVWFTVFLPPAPLALFLVPPMDAASTFPPEREGRLRILRPAAATAAIVLIAGIWLLQAVSQAGAPPFIHGSF